MRRNFSGSFCFLRSYHSRCMRRNFSGSFCFLRSYHSRCMRRNFSGSFCFLRSCHSRCMRRNFSGSFCFRRSLFSRRMRLSFSGSFCFIRSYASRCKRSLRSFLVSGANITILLGYGSQGRLFLRRLHFLRLIFVGEPLHLRFKVGNMPAIGGFPRLTGDAAIELLDQPLAKHLFTGRLRRRCCLLRKPMSNESTSDHHREEKSLHVSASNLSRNSCRRACGIMREVAGGGPTNSAISLRSMTGALP